MDHTQIGTDDQPLTNLPVQDAQTVTSGCCGLSENKWTIALAIVCLVAIGFAAYFAGQASAAKQLASASSASSDFEFPLIDASAAVTSEKFSMATGPMGDAAEGLFVLDHNSGLLQCSVMYPRSAQIGAQFTVNVADVLATGGKGGKYIMCTGTVAFPNSSNNPAAPTVVYVLDTATGNYAAYGIPFNRTYVNGNRKQNGVMLLLAKGTANPLLERDPGGR